MRFFHLTETLDAPAYCHAPADRPFDRQALVTNDDGVRWSRRGEPTIYLAGNLPTALVELGRHVGLEGRVAASDETGRVERTLWMATLRLDRVIDLRSPDVRAVLRLPDHPAWVLDRRRTLEVGSIVRSSGEVEAIRVPSAGLMDRADRWNLVIFTEALAVPLAKILVKPRAVGTVCLDQPA